MKRIGVLTGGGDSAGMNPAVRAVVRTACGFGAEVIGIQKGWLGLAEGLSTELTSKSVSGILHQGGTILRTFRYPEFATDEGAVPVAKNLEKLKLDGMIIIGGDGSFRGGTKLYKEFGVPVVGIPATIDNDIPGTDISIGFDTALNIAIDAVDKIRDTATSHGRIFVIDGRRGSAVAGNPLQSGRHMPEYFSRLPPGQGTRHHHRGRRSGQGILYYL